MDIEIIGDENLETILDQKISLENAQYSHAKIVVHVKLKKEFLDRMERLEQQVTLLHGRYHSVEPWWWDKPFKITCEDK